MQKDTKILFITLRKKKEKILLAHFFFSPWKQKPQRKVKKTHCELHPVTDGRHLHCKASSLTLAPHCVVFIRSVGLDQVL